MVLIISSENPDIKSEILVGTIFQINVPEILKFESLRIQTRSFLVYVQPVRGGFTLICSPYQYIFL